MTLTSRATLQRCAQPRQLRRLPPQGGAVLLRLPELFKLEVVPGQRVEAVQGYHAWWARGFREFVREKTAAATAAPNIQNWHV